MLCIACDPGNRFVDVNVDVAYEKHKDKIQCVAELGYRTNLNSRRKFTSDDVKKTLLRFSEKMRACVTSFEEVSIDDYLNEYNHQRNTRVIDLSKWETPPECEL